VSRLGPALRARFTLRRIALAAGLVVAFLGIVAAAEKDDGSGTPTDHAAVLVPEAALAYAHVSVEPDSQQWRDATRLARGFPRLVEVRNRFLRGLTARGGNLDLEREVYPWIADEAALALLAGAGGTARSLILLEVSDRELAQAFLARAVGRTRRSTYRGTPIRTYGRLATAFLGDFLAIGQPGNVRAAIDVRRGRLRALAATAPFRRSRAALPDEDRLFFGYGTREGLRRVLRTQPGVFGRLARLADDPELLGASIAARAEERGVWLDYAGALREGERRARAQADQPFVPELHEVVPGDAVAFLDMRGADRLFDTITEIAGGGTRLPDLLGGLGSELSGARGADIRRALRPLLGKEAALFLTPSGRSPLLTLVVNGVRSGEAATMIEELQPLIARLVERPATGQVPFFQPTRVGGRDAVTLTLTPSVELTFSVFGGRAVISTAPAGIRKLTGARSRIAGNEFFRAGTEGRLERVTSVLFLDLEQFFALGEQAGLHESASFRAFRSALSRVSTVSAVTSSTRAGKKATIFIEVP
jgi:uncharacterized protein DUF3352